MPSQLSIVWYVYFFLCYQASYPSICPICAYGVCTMPQDASSIRSDSDHPLAFPALFSHVKCLFRVTSIIEQWILPFFLDVGGGGFGFLRILRSLDVTELPREDGSHFMSEMSEFEAAKDLPVFQGSKNRWQGRDLWAFQHVSAILTWGISTPVRWCTLKVFFATEHNICESWVLNSVEIVLSRIRSKRAFVPETFESITSTDCAKYFMCHTRAGNHWNDSSSLWSISEVMHAYSSVSVPCTQYKRVCVCTMKSEGFILHKFI